MLVNSNGVDVAVVDSVAALVPRAELEGEMGDAFVGLQARLMSQALRKLTALINRSNACVVFINQLREKVGVSFGNSEVTTGGRALKFYASVRVEIRRVTAVKQGEDSIGSRARAKVVKNKIAPPFRKAEFDILFDRGIHWTGDVLDLAVERGVVEKVGAWYAFGDLKLGQGREKAADFLEGRPDVLGEIETHLMSLLFPSEEALPRVPGSADLARNAGPPPPASEPKEAKETREKPKSEKEKRER